MVYKGNYIYVGQNEAKTIESTIYWIKACDTEPITDSQQFSWFYKSYNYLMSGDYSYEQKKLLIYEDYDKERRRFERLKQKYLEEDSTKDTKNRPRIPENIRIQVWRRDDGKCARCGSRENLEYDHIVPISKGGSNTTRNIELLCEKCNRSKSNNIE